MHQWEKSDLIQVEGTQRSRERPKITLIEAIKKGVQIKEVNREYDFG